MRSTPDAVCWNDGMHLLPQHFQLQSLRAESLSAQLAANARPWYWGVQTVQIDKLALGAGLVQIKALSAVLPDGLAVDFDPIKDKDFVPQLKVTPQDFGDQRSLLVYLAVDPLWSAGQLVSLVGRLRSDNTTGVLDLSTGSHPENVTVWRPHLRLVLAAGRSDSVHLPLLRLGCEDNTISLLPYTPPCPLLLPDSPIGARIAELCQLVRDKCKYLAGRWRQAHDTGQNNESAELRMQMSALWARLPELQANLETGVATPASLYLQLTGMAGAVASLQPELGVRAFSPLDFEDLQSGFDEVLQWLELRVKLIRSGYDRRPFSKTQNVFFITLTDTGKAAQQLVIGLRMPAGSAPQAASEWLQQANIASREHLPALQRQRGGGLSFKPLQRKDQVAYGVDENTQLFMVDAQGGWFRADHELCLYMPPNSDKAAPVEVIMLDKSQPD
ncbi:type VI secretion system baseplate subunit TssK [Pseudomonas sp. 3A(2025)]